MDGCVDQVGAGFGDPRVVDFRLVCFRGSLHAEGFGQLAVLGLDLVEFGLLREGLADQFLGTRDVRLDAGDVVLRFGVDGFQGVQRVLQASDQTDAVLVGQSARGQPHLVDGSALEGDLHIHALEGTPCDGEDWEAAQLADDGVLLHAGADRRAGKPFQPLGQRLAGLAAFVECAAADRHGEGVAAGVGAPLHGGRGLLHAGPEVFDAPLPLLARDLVRELLVVPHLLFQA